MRQPPPTRLLEAGLRSLGLPVTASRVTDLLRFLALLRKWNRVYNLSGVEGDREMVTRHLLDSLAVAPYLQGPRVADVGSGAGLPGMPLAIQLPQLRFALVEASAKRVRFLTQARIELGLKNVEIHHGRVEAYGDRGGFQTVVSRAFADLGRYLEAVGPLCAPGCRILAMKGRIDPWELAQLPEGFKIVSTRELQVPGLDAQRSLIELTRREQ